MSQCYVSSPWVVYYMAVVVMGLCMYMFVCWLVFMITTERIRRIIMVVPKSKDKRAVWDPRHPSAWYREHGEISNTDW